jgi:hypothetical protein
VATFVAVSGPQVIEADCGTLAAAAVPGIEVMAGMDWPGDMVMPDGIGEPGAIDPVGSG